MEEAKGVPDFWLNVLMSVVEMDGRIYEHDIPALKHLVDISCELHTNPNVRIV